VATRNSCSHRKNTASQSQISSIRLYERLDEMKAETALVTDKFFFHYCHKAKGFICLRIHHEKCFLCGQKNPDYTKNKMIFLITDYENRPIMAFTNQDKAYHFIGKNPQAQYILHDTGLIE